MRYFTWILIITLTTFLFSFQPAKENEALPSFVKSHYSEIPSGQVTIGNESYTIARFFIQKHEVTNKDYREFLKAVGSNQYLVDSSNWASQNDSKAYAEHYHKHPAYDNYPVVNISYEDAVAYCKWLTENSKKSFETEGYTVEFRLPSRQEWVYAAQGKIKASSYSWGGPYIRNAKGQILANFRILGAENIHYDQESKTYQVIPSEYPIASGKLNSNHDVTAPVNSYSPNGYGLYNMNGNVAEMIDEKGLAAGGSWACPGYDIRNESILKHSGSDARVGFRPVMVIVKK